MGNGFLKRWSRRKMAEGEAAAKAAPVNAARAEAEGPAAPSETRPPKSALPAGAPVAAPTKETEEPVDPATLPPLDTLGPDSDYTVFLRKGVPEAIRTAALRKAWMSDPFIRDFRGPAEYALDYTTAEFDLRPTDDVAKMLDQIFPPTRGVDAAEAPVSDSEAVAEKPTAAIEDAAPRANAERIAHREPADANGPPQPSRAPAKVPDDAPPRRKHGGALPD